MHKRSLNKCKVKNLFKRKEECINEKFDDL